MSLTRDERVKYMRIAANLCQFGFKDEHIDLLVSLYEAVLEKGEDLTVRDTATIESDCKKRADIKSKQELLDKVSTKV